VPALGLAAHQGHLGIIEAILGAGADVNAVASEDSGSLRGDSEADAADALVKAGANLEMVDDHGNTPLLRAAGCGASEAMGTLLRHGAGVNK